ncbi:MAG: ABC transporter substrate-binding protein [Methanocalculus sp.]|uniref:ABC transporter substrate-binding protein n=1 Tax=Methanocalculus sp. TaxID=2004547 RepID=UPI00271F125B|nr:ABC transporter substrate-binding protein [Methanocalculus sp.]MDO9540220.1 ABC transporter substrate-binding protein [Methanocalculus sp.]
MRQLIKIFIFLSLITILITPVSADKLDSNNNARQLLSSGILAHISGGEGAPILSDLRGAAALYPEYPLQITDTAGSTFTIYRPAERVVVIHVQPAEAIIAIGGNDKLVGVGNTIKRNTFQFPPDISELPDVGTMNEPDIEAILALKPDLVLSYVDWPEPEKLERHLPAHIPVVRMDLYKTETFRSEMVSLGLIFNKEEECNEYLEWYDTNLALVQDRVAHIPDEERVRVYAEAGHGQSFGRRVYSEGTSLHDLLVAAGGINVASDYLSGIADVDEEWIIHQNPDVILIWTGRAGYKLGEEEELHSLYNDIKGMPGFSKINAVKDDKVYVLTSGYLHGTSTPVALVQIASWLYPERFDDIDTSAIFNEYFLRFSEADEVIRDAGTFFYPYRSSI